MGGKMKNFQEKPLNVMPEYFDQMKAEEAANFKQLDGVSQRELHLQQKYKSKYEKQSSFEPKSPIPAVQEEKKASETNFDTEA